MSHSASTQILAGPAAPRAASTTTRFGGALVATAAALALWCVAGPLLGADLQVRTGAEVTRVGPVSVLVGAFVAALAGWALLAVLERLSRVAARIWTGTAVVVLVLSLGGPLTLATTMSTALVLAAMHLVVAAVLIPVLRLSARLRNRSGRPAVRAG